MLTFSEVGKRMKFLREKRGLTQEGLADAVGISRSIVSEIERGRRIINSAELRRIADELEVPVGNLIRPAEKEEILAEQNNEWIKKLEYIFDEILGQLKMWKQLEN